MLEWKTKESKVSGNIEPLEPQDSLKNKDPLSKGRKSVFYKVITDLKCVQNFPGDIMHFKGDNSFSD